MKNKPEYHIGSVDHALYLAQILQQEGPLRVTDAAERLGVARSTAHRLLAMLVYRDFAERCDDRRYRAGPVMRPAESTPEPVIVLRRLAVPHLEALVAAVGETANLQVRVGTQIRFVRTVECTQVLRVGDRAGRVLSAHHTSGGKAMLAALAPDQLADLYRGADVDLTKLGRELAVVRRRGYAVNHQQSEKGVSAVGTVIRDHAGNPVAAVALAMPSVRFVRGSLQMYRSALAATVADIERDLNANRPTADTQERDHNKTAGQH